MQPEKFQQILLLLKLIALRNKTMHILYGKIHSMPTCNFEPARMDVRCCSAQYTYAEKRLIKGSTSGSHIFSRDTFFNTPTCISENYKINEGLHGKQAHDTNDSYSRYQTSLKLFGLEIVLARRIQGAHHYPYFLFILRKGFGRNRRRSLRNLWQNDAMAKPASRYQESFLSNPRLFILN